MNRADLKEDAKSAMREASVSPYLATVIVGIIAMIHNAGQSVFQLWSKLLKEGAGFPNPFLDQSYLISFLIFIIVFIIVDTIISFGYTSFCLKVANRDSSMSYLDLFASAKYLLKALGLSFMIGLLVFLWSLLLIIPGIIAVYRYSQAVFIMVENPDKGIMQCIEESKEMMIGYKWDYFILELSFILWYILGICTCGLAYIYVYPYTKVTFANFYNDLKPKSYSYKESAVIE